MAEAVGTFVLMFCICGIIGNLHFMGIETGIMEYAATAGLTVVVIVFSIGSISGAHINPAVTIAFAAAGPFPWSKVHTFFITTHHQSLLLVTHTDPNLLTLCHVLFQGSTLCSWTSRGFCFGNLCRLVCL